MAIFSANTIIRSLSIFHITIAYFLLTSPKIIADQTFVWVLGESMSLPSSPAFETCSPPLALLSVMTAFVGLSDLLAVSMPEEIAGYYFGAQAPVRLFFFFIVAGYPYVFKRDGIASQLAGEGKPYDSSGPGEHLKNSIVFSLGFIEFVTWFWVFITLREERKDAADRQVEKLKAEESMM